MNTKQKIVEIYKSDGHFPDRKILVGKTGTFTKGSDFCAGKGFAAGWFEFTDGSKRYFLGVKVKNVRV